MSRLKLLKWTKKEKQQTMLDKWKINAGWTLFLDRDGVINKRLPGTYVTSIEEFDFLPGVLAAIAHFSKLFDTIIVVTNQQGIGKGVMTEAQLLEIHSYMQKSIEAAGGRLDAIYYCPELAKDKLTCRKPNPSMAHQAKADFPKINFKQSIMVGDSVSDMEFGLNLGMKTVFIETKPEDAEAAKELKLDMRCKSLKEFAQQAFHYH